MNTRAEVLRLLKERLKPAEIARKLGISKQAVSKHVQALKASGQWVETEAQASRTTPRTVNPNGAPKGNTNALATGEYTTLWRDLLSPAEQALVDAAGGVTTKVQAAQQVALCDVLIARLVRRLERLEELPQDLMVDGETALRRLTGEQDKGGTPVAAVLPSMVITRSVTVRDAILLVQKAIKEMLKERARAVQLRAQLEAKKQPPKGDHDGDDLGLGEMSDEELLAQAQQLRRALN